MCSTEQIRAPYKHALIVAWPLLRYENECVTITD